MKNYDEFLNHTAAWLQAHFDADPDGPGAGIQVGIQDVEKLQGESYRGLTLGYPSSKVGANINPGPYFVMYLQGLPMEDALERLLQDVLPIFKSLGWTSSPESFSYEDCREHLMLELVPRKGNEEQLRSIPWREIADLALIVRVDFGGIGDSRASAVVNHSLLSFFGVSQEKLFEDALEAASRSLPMAICPMSEIIPWAAGGIPLFVATNSKGFMGASVLAYPGFGPEASRLLQDDFYIIPSSIHEVLLLPAGSVPDAAVLPCIVRTVNMGEVAPEDRLSDNVYFYSRTLGSIAPFGEEEKEEDQRDQRPLIIF